MALAKEGLTFRSDGIENGTSDVYDDQAWTTSFKLSKEFIEAHPISPSGKALKEVVKLQRNEWIEIVNKDSYALGMHIPSGEPLTASSCEESVKLAFEFFDNIVPDKKIDVIICSSWLFDDQIPSILPSTSKLSSFNEEFYLLPIKGSDAQTFERVFNQKEKDLSNLPSETSMQRAFLKFIQEGGHFRLGSCFLHRDCTGWGKGSDKFQFNFKSK